MKIYYQNNQGQTIDLMEWPYKISDSDFFDYTWQYENKNSLQPKITRFYRNLVKKTFDIGVAAYTLDAYHQAMMELLEVTEKDVLSLKPGKLYVGDTYLSCYFVSSKKTEWCPGLPFLKNTFTAVSEKGKWIRELKTAYAAGGGTPSGESYMDYAYDYAYDYSSVSGWEVLNNPGYAAADFELTVHGPCENPEVFIAGHSYAVACELALGEYLRIDSLNRKVYKVLVNGEEVNQYHLRDRDSYIFEKIPVGSCSFAWDGSFSAELVLYEERSEPRWT